MRPCAIPSRSERANVPASIAWVTRGGELDMLEPVLVQALAQGLRQAGAKLRLRRPRPWWATR